MFSIVLEIRVRKVLPEVTLKEGHSRALTIKPFERPHLIFCQYFIVTMYQNVSCAKYYRLFPNILTCYIIQNFICSKRVGTWHPKSNKKLSYHQGTVRCIMSVEILPIATQQCRNYVYNKSWTKYQSCHATKSCCRQRLTICVINYTVSQKKTDTNSWP